jgi:hypothetical protein
MNVAEVYPMNHAEEKVAGFFTCNNGRVRVMLACLLQGGRSKFFMKYPG